jgi:predicted amidohydrolase YtcJ
MWWKVKFDSGVISGVVSFAITTILATMSFGGDVDPADMVLLNGKIVTVDSYQPQAEAIAIKDDLITAVGSNEDVKSYVDEHTVVIDLEGKLAVPGFIDGHVHFMGIGYAQMRLKLAEANSWEEIIGMVKTEVHNVQPGDWIIGRGWHQDKWNAIPNPNVDGLPFHHELSKVSPDNPVLLSHASGHACIANTAAMAMSGITVHSIDPDGGEIIRDANGEPIGVFLETAMDTLFAIMDNILDARGPEEIERERWRATELAVEECLSKGVTTVHDAGVGFETIDFFKRIAEEGALDIRLWVMISEENDSLMQRIDDYRLTGFGDNHLTVRAIKRVIDGALGSRGAWLLEPYSDLPQSTGLNTESIDVMKETARIAIEHDFQLCTHAIGDRANRETLNIYENAQKGRPDKSDLRWRIEHAQHIHPDDIPRFGQLGIIASMQTVHCTSDGPWVPKRLGERRVEEGAYVWQKLMQSGAVISNGTDAPVEDVDPLANFHAAVTRMLPDESQFQPKQRMSREEALRSYTINAAYAAFEENFKGSITPGKLADITVLSRDIMTIPENEILETRVLHTIVGGKIMYRSNE